MIGAIVGDIAGSPYEFDNIKTTAFPLFGSHHGKRARPTDDSVMTLAVARALLDAADDPAALPAAAVRRMQEFGRRYQRIGYGPAFYRWLFAPAPKPYNSWGNGAAMRVSACGWAARTLDEALAFSDAVTGVTHNHPEGLKGARAVTAAIFLLRTGVPFEEIWKHITETYYPLDFYIDDIRTDYEFDVSCQGSVPQALKAFSEADETTCGWSGVEHAVRNAVSIGGDSDTIAAIAGAVAEARWGVPDDLRNKTLARLDDFQRETVEAFEARFGAPVPNRPWDIDGVFLTIVWWHNPRTRGNLPANIALCWECEKIAEGILVQRNHDKYWQHENVFRISLDDDPVVDGDTGDITGDEIVRLKDFVRRNRDLIHAHWIGKKDSSVVFQLKFD